MLTLEQKSASYYAQVFFLADSDAVTVRAAGEQLTEADKADIHLHFYAWMRSHELFQPHYTEDVIQALRDSEDLFWSDFVLGDFGEDYVLRQRYFGEIFANFGIPFEAYIAMLACYHEQVRTTFAKRGMLSAELLRAFDRLANTAVAIIADGYNAASMAMLHEKNRLVLEMSSPIAQLWDGISLLPLVGYIDSNRAQAIMDSVLRNIEQVQPLVFIVDISGVAAIDTAIANHIIKITKATRLMGCVCMLSGISPAVAQTIVELGVHTDEIITTSTMKNAVRRALRLVAQEAQQNDDWQKEEQTRSSSARTYKRSR